jgi:hypothetical protein
LHAPKEFVLLWRSSRESDWRDIVRQQFDFAPPHSSTGREELNVSLNDVISIELRIVPDINGKGRASLRELLLG